MTLEDIEKQVLLNYGDGNNFLDNIDDALINNGYTYNPDAPCNCPDEGKYGHHWSCGWELSNLR